MYIWIWVTIAAALSQSLELPSKKNLQPVLGNLGASFVGLVMQYHLHGLGYVFTQFFLI